MDIEQRDTCRSQVLDRIESAVKYLQRELPDANWEEDEETSELIIRTGRRINGAPLERTLTLRLPMEEEVE